jgi:toxin YoeB
VITDALRNPFTGIGKPEPLKQTLSAAWSRRIDDINRLVYVVTDDPIAILHARQHC